MIVITGKMLSISGLVLDAAGVIFLGVDLVRVQKGLIGQSRQDSDALETITEEFGGVQDWLHDISKSGRWEQTDYNEGMTEFFGGFNPQAADQAFSDLAQATRASQQHIERIAELVAAQVKSSEHANARSLLWSYLGLSAIFIGFILQILSIL